MPNHALPLAIKVIEGKRSPKTGELYHNNRKIKENGISPSDDLTPPKLGKAELAVWNRVTGAMTPGVYLGTDKIMLTLLCVQVARFEKATAILAKHGEEVEGSQGQPVVSPWSKIQDAASDRIMKLCARLGLDPIARQALNAPPASEDDGWVS